MFSDALGAEGDHAGDGAKTDDRPPGGEPGRHETELSHGDRDAIEDEEQEAKADAHRKENADAAAAAKARGKRYADGDHQQGRDEEGESLVPPGLVDPGGADAEALV